MLKIRQWLMGDITTRENVDHFRRLFDCENKIRILVIGGGTVGVGLDLLIKDLDCEIVVVDVYASDAVDYVCDSHYLPFKDSSFDAVWIQAVLEHVIDPKMVVAQIARVLKPKGAVYAETPFMQPVHEGAYDYTRFTVLGHRYLFRDFRAVKFGANRGADIALAWSLKYFMTALLRSKNIGRACFYLAIIFLLPVRPLLSRWISADSASGVFFVGVKTESRLTHRELPKLYRIK
ncbi:class I SAM-dependent methyltransferase [Litorivicinus sp.]|nr:class I SAM-dependent methyltransferase [Litorivicinus sp.]